MNSYTLETITVNASEEFSAVITEDMVEKFRSITGDVNPLHTDENFAVTNGFRSRVVYGMLTSSFYSTLAGVYLPGRNCLLYEVDSQLVKPVYIGDKLLIKGTISEINKEMGYVRIKARITNQNNETVSRAKIMAGIKNYV